MICSHVDEFRQSSVAVQVLVIVYSCGHAPATVTSANVIASVVSQASIAVATPSVAVSTNDVQSTIVSIGHVIIGAVVS
jgi:hypothetical protein